MDNRNEVWNHSRQLRGSGRPHRAYVSRGRLSCGHSQCASGFDTKSEQNVYKVDFLSAFSTRSWKQGWPTQKNIRINVHNRCQARI